MSMSDALPGLIVLAIGGSIAPPLLPLTILFVGSQGPLSNPSALALGLVGCAAMEALTRGIGHRRQVRAAETYL
jgi:hypothetical protein